MTTPSPNKLFILSLAMLLFLPVVPASAGDSAGSTIDLRLEQALALKGETFELGEIAGDQEAVAEFDLEKSDLMSLKDSPLVRQVAAEQHLADQARGNRGFGRWLKKHWYVPVLVAAAAVALSGDDGGVGH